MSSRLRPLARQLPAGILRFDPPALQANSGDAWMASALPEAVAFPRTTAQVSKSSPFATAGEFQLQPAEEGAAMSAAVFP